MHQIHAELQHGMLKATMPVRAVHTYLCLETVDSWPNLLALCIVHRL